MSEEPSTAEDLRTQIARLQAENEALRRQSVVAEGTVPPTQQGQPSRRSGRWRPFVAAVLIVLGCLLAPVAVVGAWAKATLTDTDRFVATYAPLAHDPAVQAYVVDQTMNAINQNVDIGQLTSEVIDGIKQLGVGSRAGAALDQLRGPAAQGVQNVIRSGVNSFVTSDAFPAAWERALRLSHNQLIATLGNDPQALLAARADGSIGIQLGPIIAEVKQSLLDRGISVASRIPEVNRTIPVAQVEQLPSIQLAYRGVLAAGTWLPWVVVVMLVAGVLVARRRARTLVWTAVGFALGMVVLLAGIATGRVVLLTTLPPSLVPSNVVTTLYATVTTAMKDTATVAVVFGIVVALVGWLAGPFTTPRRLRGLYTDGVGQLRMAVERRGVSTGRVGDWLYGQRRILQTLVAVGGVGALVLLRPLTIGEIIGTLAVALGVLIVLSLIERPPSKDVAAGEAETTAGDQPTMRLPAS